MKRSKWLVIALLLIVSSVHGQANESSANEEALLEDFEQNTSSSYYAEFDDSSYEQMRNVPLDRPLSEEHWKSIYRNVNFDEDTIEIKKKNKKKNEKYDKKSSEESKITPTSKTDNKGLWYIIAIGIMAVVIWQVLKYLNLNNKENKEENVDFLLNEEHPEEEELRKSNLKTPFQSAYQKGDYRLAFRIRYLDILKLLMERNHIIYKKEKTNMDYLRQVQSRNYLPIFSRLTLAFDTIWYGDLIPSKEEFDSLFADFNEMEREVNNA